MPAIVPGALSAPCAGDRGGRPRPTSSSAPTSLARPKSSTFTAPSVPDHHVGRFEIAMDDAARVRGRQRVGDRDGDPERLAEAHALPRNERIDALAAHVLHHDEVVIRRPCRSRES